MTDATPPAGFGRLDLSAFAAAPSAPLIWLHHAAREDRTIRFKSLPGHAQTEAVESSEGG